MKSTTEIKATAIKFLSQGAAKYPELTAAAIASIKAQNDEWIIRWNKALYMGNPLLPAAASDPQLLAMIERLMPGSPIIAAAKGSPAEWPQNSRP